MDNRIVLVSSIIVSFMCITLSIELDRTVGPNEAFNRFQTVATEGGDDESVGLRLSPPRRQASTCHQRCGTVEERVRGSTKSYDTVSPSLHQS